MSGSRTNRSRVCSARSAESSRGTAGAAGARRPSRVPPAPESSGNAHLLRFQGAFEEVLTILAKVPLQDWALVIGAEGVKKVQETLLAPNTNVISIMSATREALASMGLKRCRRR